MAWVRAPNTFIRVNRSRTVDEFYEERLGDVAPAEPGQRV